MPLSHWSEFLWEAGQTFELMTRTMVRGGLLSKTASELVCALP